jgi:hypothetical protein
MGDLIQIWEIEMKRKKKFSVFRGWDQPKPIIQNKYSLRQEKIFNQSYRKVLLFMKQNKYY